ncbi:putative polysaccharide biosynthesis protein [Halobacillus seohaensis]|uniref:Oligosaccharide flippase family protein n=1 Tax=Halobacillus seohaensis TaxID=447421 RepID=A0ABW2EQ20_9BACI
MKRSTFVKSTLILSFATLLSKVLGSIFRIPLQNIAGDEVLGIFTLVYPIYMVALILSVAGIPIAISKLIAEARTQKDDVAIFQIKRTASILALLFGVISFTLLYAFSESISTVLGDPSTRPALIVVSTTLLVAPFMAVYRGYFQGFEDMRPTAISQVLEQLIRVGLILISAIYFVSRGYSNEVVAAGVMLGSIVGVLVSLVYLLLLYKNKVGSEASLKHFSYKTFLSWSKTILKVSIPIAIGTITMALLNAIDSLTIPYALHSQSDGTNNVTYLYGIYGRGLALVQIATVFATSVVLPLIPLMTKKLTEKKYDQTRQLIEKTNHLSHLISWPAAFGLLALTLPLNITLFTNLEGSTMLGIIGFSSVFTSLAIVGTGILQGMNLTKTAALIVIGSVILKAFINIIMIHYYGITGAALSTLFVYIMIVVINTIFIYKKFNYNLFPRELPKIVLSALNMGIVIAIPALWFTFENWSRVENMLYLLIVITLGGLFYFCQLFLMKVVNKQSLSNLPVIGDWLKR